MSAMNKQSGHGGHRAGAGRKPLLPFEERISIAVDFEQRVTAVQRAKADERARETDPTLEHIEEFSGDIQSVPLSARRSRSRDKTEFGDGDSRIDELVGDLRSWIDERGSRLVTKPIRRLYRERGSILEAVAEAATQRYGVTISARFVEGCVEEYRRLFPRTSAES
jgi:hypothetical protein